MKKACCIIAFLFFITFGRSQNRELDSLKSLLQNEMHDTTRLSLILKILNGSEGDTYKEYSKMMLELSQKNIANLKPDSYLLKIYLNYLAEAYYYEGELFYIEMDFQKALSAYEKSVSLGKKTGNNRIVGANKIEIASILTTQEDYKKAIETLYESLKLFHLISDQKNIGKVYNDIGRIYRRQKNYKKAIEFNEKSLDAYKIANWKIGIVHTLNKLSYIYSEINDSSKSLNCILNTEKIINTMSESEKSPHQILINSILAKAQRAKGNNAAAIDYLNKNIILLKNAGILFELGSNYSNISDIYLKTKHYQKAILYAEKAQTMNIQTHNDFGQYKECEKLYKLYKLVGDSKNALKMHEQFVILNDSIQRKKDEKHIIEAELKYEFEKKELLAKIATEKKINELSLLAERKNAKKNVLLSILAGVLLLIITASCFIYYYFRQKSIIQNQKNNLLKQKLLLSQMNPHFIFNSLNAIQNYIFKKNILQAGIYLSQFAEMIRMILDFSRKDYITLDSELKFLEHYLKLQQLRFENKFDYQLIIDKEIDTETTLLPPMMAQPFIENAIEHGIFYKTGKGNINITFNKNNKELEYIIEDDGIGLNASKKLRSYTEPKHESLAMTITGERMQVLYNNIKKEPIIELIDKKDLDLNTTGVKVKFSIQFKELLSYDKYVNN